MSEEYPNVSRDSLDLWQKLKQDRMTQIIDYLRRNGSVNRSQFIGRMCVQGFHIRTVQRYLREIEEAGLIRIVSNQIVWIDNEHEER